MVARGVPVRTCIVAVCVLDDVARRAFAVGFAFPVIALSINLERLPD